MKFRRREYLRKKFAKDKFEGINELEVRIYLNRHRYDSHNPSFRL